MTHESVYLLVIEDKEGGGDTYFRVFNTLELAQAAMWECRDGYNQYFDNVSPYQHQLNIKYSDYIDKNTYCYIVDTVDLEIHKLSVETS